MIARRDQKANGTSRAGSDADRVGDRARRSPGPIRDAYCAA